MTGCTAAVFALQAANHKTPANFAFAGLQAFCDGAAVGCVAFT
jgi:hypothetical protein